jgi:hypothetical protein
MTTTSHAHPQRSEKNQKDAEAIPVDDVPAFGVQIRFAKRTLQDLLAQFRTSRNGSHKRT